MPRQRDYKAEYASRIAQGLAKGLTRGQARGHPEAGKVLASAKPTAGYNPKLEEAVKHFRRGESLSSAAKSAHVSAERLSSYVASEGIATKTGGRWRLGADDRIRPPIGIFSEGQEIEVTVKGYEQAKLASDYLNAVKRFITTNDPSHLDLYRGQSIVDVHGKRHVFETDENTLYRLNESGDQPYESMYRMVQ
ncbi:hypothetical protein LLG46_05800 [bacterium]|nr:hypothetical protein [bacterium]